MILKKNTIFFRVLNNFSWLTVLTILSHLFSFITLSVLIKKYSLSNVGIILTMQAVLFLMAAITNFSFTFFIPTQSKKISSNKHYCLKLWHLVVNVRLFLTIILTVISLMLVYCFYNTYWSFWLLSLPILISKIVNPNLFFNAFENNKLVFKIGFFSRLLFLILVCLSNSLLLVNPFLALSEIVVIVFFIYKSNPSFLRFTLLPIKTLAANFKHTTSLFFVNMASIITTQTILPAISWFLGSESAAIYGIAEKVVKSFTIVSGNLFTSFFPVYNKNELQTISKKNYLVFSLLPIILIGLIWFFSDYIVYVLNNFTVNSTASLVLKIAVLVVLKSFIVLPFFSYLLQHKHWNAILVAYGFQIGAFLLCFIYLYISRTVTVIDFTVISIVIEYVLLLAFMYCFFKLKSKQSCPK